MSKAKNSFDLTVERCNSLVVAAKTETACADDMLRFAIVLAVAAFDSYVADRFSEHFVSFIKNSPSETKTVKFLDTISFGTKEMVALLCANRDRPFRTIHAAVDRYLATKSFQSEKAIGTLFSLYGLPHLFGDSIKKAGGKRTDSQIRNMIQRRHSIVHACDMKNNGEPRTIDAATVKRWIVALSRLTAGMDEIVDNRFSLHK